MKPKLILKSPADIPVNALSLAASMPQKPSQEFVVALAGPAVNVSQLLPLIRGQ
jgi:hypothetical protein